MADIPGWPFYSPPRVPMQKCNKCSREFCSTINHRRHMLLHRRNLNIDKDSTSKNRGLLQAFWDKLSAEESMEILSFNDVSLAGVPGSSIVRELTSLILKARSSTLPMSYAKAGSALLDIIQARPGRFPILSSDLFSILDEASEKTFLCAGTAGSLQKYVFNGDAGKMGLEMRNLIACACFLIEQKLVTACLADKDAEALRNQRLLMEEEEAAQRRQAALLEKKRLKKLKQKELRAKELATTETYESPENTVDDPDSDPETPEIPPSPTSSPEALQNMNPQDVEESHDTEYSDFSMYQKHRTLHRNGRRRVVNSHHWQALRMPRSGGYQAAKPGPTQKHVSYRVGNANNGTKVWTPKPKPETDESLPVEDKKCEVLIGSISVTLGKCKSGQNGQSFDLCENPDKIEAVQRTANHPSVKLWRPVNRHENGSGSKVSAVACSDNGEQLLRCSADTNGSGCECCTVLSMEENGNEECLKFSSNVAEAFLAKRWKDVISSDHVKLVLFPESKPPDSQEDSRARAAVRSVNSVSTEKSSESLESSAVTKPTIEKDKVKYIPKQRSVT